MLHIRMIGPFEASVADERLTFPSRQDSVRLWQYLLLHRSTPVTRDAIVDALWPDADPDKSRGYLRVSLHGLSAFLKKVDENTDWIKRDRRTVQWNPEGPAWLDIEEFEQLALREKVVDSLDEVEPRKRQERIVELFRGPLLSGQNEAWAEAPRARIHDLALRALISLAHLRQSRGDIEGSAAALESLLSLDPLQEAQCRVLMGLYVQLGRRDAALACYERLSTALEDRLNVLPARETRALLDRVRRNEQLELKAEVSPDLEDHPPTRLRMPLSKFIGRTEAQDALQGLLETSRLVTVLGPGGAGKTRLALQVAHRVETSQDSDVRMVDLSSSNQGSSFWPAIAEALDVPPSASKSSQESVTDSVQEHPILMLIDNCEHLFPSIASNIAILLEEVTNMRILATSRIPLEIDGEARFPIGPMEVPETHFHESDIASISKTESVELFMDRALSIRPNLTPRDDDWKAIGEICHRVDGLPLALELAAARLNVLSPKDLNVRLTHDLTILRSSRRGTPDRHRTLDACIAWSIGMLRASECSLLEALSVFPGSFTLREAAASLDEDDELQVLDVLARLLDCALILPVNTSSGRRFRLLQPVREHLLHAIAPDRIITVERRIASHVLERSLDTLREGIAQASPVDGNETSGLATVRLAFDLYRSDSEPGGAMTIAGANWRSWSDRGHCQEERLLVESLLSESESEVSASQRADASTAAGGLAYRLGDLPSALDHFQSAVLARRESGNTVGEAVILEYVCLVSALLGDPDTSRAAFARLSSLNENSDPSREASLLATLAWMETNQGNFIEARRALERCLKIGSSALSPLQILDHRAALARVLYALGEYELARREIGTVLEAADDVSIVVSTELQCQMLLGLIANARADHSEATRLLREAVDGWRDEGNSRELARAFHNLAEVSLSCGDDTTARLYLQKSRTLKVEASDEWGLIYTDVAESTLAIETGDPKQGESIALSAISDARARKDVSLTAWALQTAARAALADNRPQDSVSLLAECALILSTTRESLRICMLLERAAWYVCDTGEPALSAKLLGRAAAERERIGAPPTVGEAADVERLFAKLEAALNSSELESALSAGRDWTIDEALETVRGFDPAGSGDTPSFEPSAAVAD